MSPKQVECLKSLETALKDCYLECNHEHVFDFDEFNFLLEKVWEKFEGHIDDPQNFVNLVCQLFSQGFEQVCFPASVFGEEVDEPQAA